VVEGAPAFGQAQRPCAQGASEPPELFHERIRTGERDRAARERAGGLSRFSEHVQRMKTARKSAVGNGFFQRIELGGAAAVHAGRARAPLDAGCNRFDRIVGHGKKNDVGAVGDFLRHASPRAANALRELLRGGDLPARDRDDGHARMSEACREPRAHAARADEAEGDFFGTHLLRIVRGCERCRLRATDHFGHRVNAGGTLAFIGYVSAAMDINS
jgi:hypothetical protein